MKFKITNVLAILLAIIIIGGILYPWSKKNVESFVANSSSNPTDINSTLESIKTVFQNLVETRLYAKDFNDRVNALKIQLDKNGTVDSKDYLQLINDVKKELSNQKLLNSDLGNQIKMALNDETINKLSNDINIFSDKVNTVLSGSTDPTATPGPSQSSNSIKSIKTIQSGMNLNVNHLSSNNLGQETFAQLKNLDPDNANIMIHMNNGCLTYNGDKYISKHCELTNREQYFVFKRIESGEKLLMHLKGDYLEMQKNFNVNDNPELYPFNIVYPIDDPYKCVELDYDGLSIVDCRPSNLNVSQRWINSLNTRWVCF